jgi:hypothetical protein
MINIGFKLEYFDPIRCRRLLQSASADPILYELPPSSTVITICAVSTTSYYTEGNSIRTSSRGVSRLIGLDMISSPYVTRADDLRFPVFFGALTRELY